MSKPLLIAGALVALALAVGLFIALSRAANSRRQAADETAIDPTISGLRDILYDPQRMTEMGVPSTSQDTVQGVIVEVGRSGTVAIAAAFADGTSRLLLGQGGAVLGDPKDFPPETISAARNLVKVAQSTLAYVPLDASRALPRQNRVRFVLLTSGGMHSTEVNLADLASKDAPLAPLWDASNQLMKALISFMNEMQGQSPP